jgi:hypothetical protein
MIDMIDLKERSIQPTVYFRTLFSWIDDARILTSYGLTAKTYSLVFENDGDEVVWARLWTAALMQMKMLESYRRVGMEVPPSRACPHNLRSMLSAPTDLPDWLPDTLRSMTGTGPCSVRYKGSLERLPQTEELDSIIVHKSVRVWIDEWEELLGGYLYLEPVE